jgi:hypothetical protein
MMSEWWHWISFESPIGKNSPQERKKERMEESSARNLH